MNSQDGSQDGNGADSDDEIAELRFQALLTKRENEAEISPARESYPANDFSIQNSLSQPLSNYRGNNFRHRGVHRPNQYYNKTYLQSFSQQIASQSVNSSNIVVLTSSDDTNQGFAPDWSRGRGSGGRGGRWPRGRGNPMPRNLPPNLPSSSVTPKLILPQDKYSQQSNTDTASADASKAKLSARMRRLQGSDSDSEDSESDSSDDSSSDSSGSDSNSSSSDSSSSDSDSDSGDSSIQRSKKSEKLVKKEKVEKLPDEKIPPRPSKESVLDSDLAKSSITNIQQSSLNRSNSPTRVPAVLQQTLLPKKLEPHSPTFRREVSRSPSKKYTQPFPSKRRPSSRSPPRYHSRSPQFKRKSISPQRSPLLPRRLRTPRRSKSFSPKRFSRSPRRSRTPLRKYASRSPTYRRHKSKSPLYITHNPLRRFKSKSPLPVPKKFSSKSPNRRFRSKSPFLTNRYRSRSPLPRRSSRSPPIRFKSKSPIRIKRYSSRSPLPKRYGSITPPPIKKYGSRSPLPIRNYGSNAPLNRRLSPRSPKLHGVRRNSAQRFGSPSPVSRRKRSRSLTPKRYVNHSPKLTRSPLYKGYSLKSPKARISSISPRRRRTSFSPTIKRFGSRSPIDRIRNSLSPSKRSRSPLYPIRRKIGLSPEKHTSPPRNIKRIGSLSPKAHSLKPQVHSIPFSKPQRGYLSPERRRAFSPHRKYGSRSPPVKRYGSPLGKRLISPAPKIPIPRSQTPISFKSDRPPMLRRLSPRAQKYASRSPSPYFRKRLSPTLELNKAPPRSNSPAYYGSWPDHFNRGNVANPEVNMYGNEGNVNLPLRRYPNHNDQQHSQWVPPHKGQLFSPHKQPPLLSHYPPKFSNTDQTFGNRSNYMPQSIANIGNPPPPQDKIWQHGPPPRNFGNYGAQQNPRFERFPDNRQPPHLQHNIGRGRGNIRGFRGQLPRGVHARLGGGRGAWTVQHQDQRNFEPNYNDPYYRENQARGIPTLGQEMEGFIEDKNVSHEHKKPFIPHKVVSPGAQRIPRGPKTPPYSPKREPSPLEWQKRGTVYPKERTPTLSPSPSRRFGNELKPILRQEDQSKPQKDRNFTKKHQDANVVIKESIMSKGNSSYDSTRADMKAKASKTYDSNPVKKTQVIEGQDSYEHPANQKIVETLTIVKEKGNSSSIANEKQESRIRRGSKELDDRKHYSRDLDLSNKDKTFPRTQSLEADKRSIASQNEDVSKRGKERAVEAKGSGSPRSFSRNPSLSKSRDRTEDRASDHTRKEKDQQEHKKRGDSRSSYEIKDVPAGKPKDLWKPEDKKEKVHKIVDKKEVSQGSSNKKENAKELIKDTGQENDHPKDKTKKEPKSEEKAKTKKGLETKRKSKEFDDKKKKKKKQKDEDKLKLNKKKKKEKKKKKDSKKKHKRNVKESESEEEVPKHSSKEDPDLRQTLRKGTNVNADEKPKSNVSTSKRKRDFVDKGNYKNDKKRRDDHSEVEDKSWKSNKRENTNNKNRFENDDHKSNKFSKDIDPRRVGEDSGIRKIREENDTRMGREDNDARRGRSGNDNRRLREDSDIRKGREEPDIRRGREEHIRRGREDDIRRGREDLDIRRGREDLDIRRGREDTDFRGERDDSDFRREREDPDFRREREDSDFRRDREDLDFRREREESDIKRLRDESEIRRGREEIDIRRGRENNDNRRGRIDLDKRGREDSNSRRIMDENDTRLAREENDNRRAREDREVMRGRDSYKQDQIEVPRGGKGLLVTVGSGDDRQVTSEARNIIKGAKKKSDSVSRIPVHLRLGPSSNEGKIAEDSGAKVIKKRMVGGDDTQRRNKGAAGGGRQQGGRNIDRRQNTR